MVRLSRRGSRPCRVCRRWFCPDPRLGDRQKTCGHPECRQEWHRKQCATWNKKNRDYFQANYLQKKLDLAGQVKTGADPEGPQGVEKPASHSVRLKQVLVLIQEMIGIEQWVIIEYFLRIHFKGFQEVIKRKLYENTG